MRTPLRFALLAAVLVSVAGCRFKGYESFSKATSSREAEAKERNFSDPYGYGGVADASGGLNPKTRYGEGARKGGAILPGFDQPAKGSGQQPGENPNVADAGHAQSNAPGLQPPASDVGH